MWSNLITLVVSSKVQHCYNNKYSKRETYFIVAHIDAFLNSKNHYIFSNFFGNSK